MKENLKTLQNFLNTKGNLIPIIEKKQKTFLGIAKQPHYENVMSNILAFYFDAEEEHGLSDLFIKSLIEIIHNKTKKNNIALDRDFKITTEFTTKKKGRIDILLQSRDQAIIIENKVYHELINDLDDYWDSVVIQEANKIGVVLSLKPQSNINHKHFINITHFDFLKKVIEDLPNYQTEIPNKYIVFVQDLYQNTKNLSNKLMKKEEIDFYFNNKEQINKAKELYFGTRNYIDNAIINAAFSHNDFKKYNPNSIEHRGCYFVSPKNRDLMITITFDNLMTEEGVLNIIVELQHKLIENKGLYDKLIFDDDEKALLNTKFISDTNTDWVHFAAEKIKYEDVDLQNLTQFVLDRLEKTQPIRRIYEKVKEIIPKL